MNRVFSDKPSGLVVDYLGLAEELKQALRERLQAETAAELAALPFIKPIADAEALVEKEAGTEK